MNDTAGALGFDFHCHIDLYPDPISVISECEANRILTLAVTTTPKAWPQNKLWTAKSRWVHAAVGLHPELVGQRHHEVALLEHYIGESRLVGEIGLDGSPQHRPAWNLQLQVFSRALIRAQSLSGRVASIHSRRAPDDVVALLEKHTTRDAVLPVLHWFSGSVKSAQRASSHGCYFSINRRMLEHETGRTLVRSLPHDRLLLETDAPFTSVGGSPAKPTSTIIAALTLARVLDVAEPKLCTVLAENASRVLAFAGITLPPSF